MFECVICKTNFEIESYGDGTCPICGQYYYYTEEYVADLTENQLTLLRAEKMIPSTRKSSLTPSEMDTLAPFPAVLDPKMFKKTEWEFIQAAEKVGLRFFGTLESDQEFVFRDVFGKEVTVFIRSEEE